MTPPFSVIPALNYRKFSPCAKECFVFWIPRCGSENGINWDFPGAIGIKVSSGEACSAGCSVFHCIKYWC